MLLPVKERQPAIGLINREINVEKSSLSPSLSSHVPEQINLDVLKKELNEWNLLPLKKEKEQKEQISDYKVYKLLGKGGFAKVYYGINRKEGKKLAIKVLKKKEVNKNDSAKLRVKKEIKIQNFLKHKNILKIFTFFEDKQNIYLTLELCPYGDMLQYLKSKRPNLILEEEVRMILDQVVDALIYLHSFNILHRDLKLSNLLIYDQSTIKLSDFGLATQIQEDIGEQKTLCGTLNYISPEIIHRKPYNLQSDLWSLGCLTYTLLTGKAPFEGTNIKETIKKVSNVEYNLPEGISLEAVQLIQSLLRFEPRKRIQLKDLLMLPFFHKNRLRLNLDLLYLKDNTKEEKQSNSITDIELNNHIYNKDININNNNNNNIISIDNQNQKNYFTVNNTNNGKIIILL
ncbi:kinase-like protein [Neoconidiobolus thromboides FSU 785]|nr:kinase-like protein [Neoconidiobolus thromboides FSU 785]